MKTNEYHDEPLYRSVDIACSDIITVVFVATLVMLDIIY